MPLSWQLLLIVVAALLVAALGAFVAWCARSPMTIGERKAFLQGLGSDLIKLRGWLRGLAADPRTPRRARWMLIALAVSSSLRKNCSRAPTEHAAGDDDLKNERRHLW